MHSDKYDTALKLMRRIMWTLFGLSLFTGLIIFVTEGHLQLRFDMLGFNSFFDIYAVPVKLILAGFAVLAVWLTLERMKQTERQLQITSDNNLFNNYYRHIDEFVKYISEDLLLKLFAKSAGAEMRMLLATVHKQYYCDSYKTFVPHIRADVKEQFQDFHKALQESPLAHPDTKFRDIPLSTLRDILALVDKVVSSFDDPITTDSLPNVQVHLSTIRLAQQDITEQVERYRKISAIYFANSFYMNVLAFEGEVLQPVLELGPKYSEYITFLGVPK